jgi:hypothetical protein
VFSFIRANADFAKLDVLYESEDAKALIISAHGMLPILEILEPCTVKSRQDMILWLLKVVNTVSDESMHYFNRARTNTG